MWSKIPVKNVKSIFTSFLSASAKIKIRFVATQKVQLCKISVQYGYELGVQNWVKNPLYVTAQEINYPCSARDILKAQGLISCINLYVKIKC